jgi:uncharacterized protein YhdP
MTRKNLYRALLLALSISVVGMATAFARKRVDLFLKDFLQSTAAKYSVQVAIGSVRTHFNGKALTAELEHVAVSGEVGLSLRTVSIELDIVKSLRAGKPEMIRIAVDGVEVSAQPSIAIPASANQPTSDADHASVAGSPRKPIADFLSSLGPVNITDVTIALPALGQDKIRVSQLTLLPDPGNRRQDVKASFFVGTNKSPIIVNGSVDTRLEGTLSAELALSTENLSLPAYYLKWLDPKLLGVPAIAIKELTVASSMEWGENHWSVALTKIKLNSTAAAATGSLEISAEKAKSPTYLMDFAIARAGPAVLNYLPASIMGTGVHSWLKANLLSAEVDRSNLHLAIEAGTVTSFTLALGIGKGELIFLEPWPTVKLGRSQIVINSVGLVGEISAATIGAINLDPSTVKIGFGGGPVESAVTVVTGSKASIQEFLDTAAQFPTPEKREFLKDWIAGGSGSGQLDLMIAVPLKTGSVPVIQGHISLTDVQMAKSHLAALALSPLAVVAAFDLQSLTVEKASGRTHGQPFASKGKIYWPDDENGVRGRFDFFGSGPVESLKKAAPRFVDGHGRVTYLGNVNFADDKGLIAYRSDVTLRLDDAELNVAGIGRKSIGEKQSFSLEMSGDQYSATFYAKANGNIIGLAAMDFAEPTSLRARISTHADIVSLPEKSGELILDLDAVKGRIQFGKTWTAGPHVIDLEMLKIAELDAGKSTELPESLNVVQATKAVSPPVFELDPLEIPAITLSCAKFEGFDHVLRNVYVRAEKVESGIMVRNFRTDNGSFSIYNGTASFLNAGKSQPSFLAKGSYVVRDLPKLASDLKLDIPFISGRGEGFFRVVNADGIRLGKPGALVTHSTFSLENIAIAGLGDQPVLKTLNLLTLHVLSSGSDIEKIDSLRGSISYDGKKVQIIDGKLVSPALDMTFAGHIGMVQQDLDLQVQMTTKISRTINAIALGLVNPLLAVGYLGAEQEFSGVQKIAELISLDRLTRYSFELTGDLDHPKMHSTSLPGFF